MDIILRASEIPPDLLEFFEPIEWGAKSDTWTLGPESYSGAHYATFPTKLVEPCVLAGTSAHGCCSKCGAPWERIVEKPDMSQRPTRSDSSKMNTDAVHISNGWAGYPKSAGQAYQEWRNANPDVTIGWQPTCQCQADVIPCTVLDPFCGSGTTLAVALKFGRRAIGIDLDARNMDLAHDRIARMQPMLFEVTP